VCWLIGGLWLVLTGYLTFAAIGVKRDTRLADGPPIPAWIPRVHAGDQAARAVPVL